MVVLACIRLARRIAYRLSLAFKVFVIGARPFLRVAQMLGTYIWRNIGGFSEPLRFLLYSSTSVFDNADLCENAQNAPGQLPLLIAE
jgi:hypothetical protein